MLKKMTGRAPSLGKQVLQSLIWAVGWTLAASMVVAWMLNREVLRIEQTGYASMTILLVCGLLLAQKSDPGPGKQRIVSTAIGAGVYFLGLILINWLFFGGNFTGFGVTLIVLLAGAALGNLTLWKGRGGSTRSRYKIPKI